MTVSDLVGSRGLLIAQYSSMAGTLAPPRKDPTRDTADERFDLVTR